MAHLLGAEGLRLDYGFDPVLDSVSLGLDDGARVGVVGANGAGKSSLLRLLAGRLEPQEGRVTRARGVRVGMVDQSDALAEDAMVATAVVGQAADHEWAADPRVREVLAGLVPDIAADQPVASLSGGQRRRVALAKVLIGDHDVLFLDEPTNHLDVDGVAWLAGHLRGRWARGRGALAVVTHDRWFLDEVSTETWEVRDGAVERYEGGYAAYVLQRVERDRMAHATERRRQNLLRKELAWLRRGAPARTSKPKFRVDAANALIADVPAPRDQVALTRLAAARLGKEVVSLIGCGVAYGSGDDAREVLRGVDWSIGPGERTGILGENGAGKSTLLRLLTGEQEPTSGRVKRGLTVRVGTLSQDLRELAEHLDARLRTVVGRYSALPLADGSEATPGQLLERLGFASSALNTPVRSLSGGQRRRLQLLLALLERPNLLVLDEPTNDLDTDMLAAIEDLLDSWPGALVVVSHDRYLLERVTDQQYAVIDGGLRHLPGGVEEYVALSRERRGATGVGGFGAAAAGGPETGTESASGPTAGPSLSGAARRALEKELAAAERRLERLTGLVAAVDERMAGADPADYGSLAPLQAERQQLTTERESLEARWLELGEALG